MVNRHVARAIPGVLAAFLIVSATMMAAVSGTASLFYEGWGRPAADMLSYVAPAVVLLVLGLIALRWPAPGGALLLIVAVVRAAWWMRWQLQRHIAPLDLLLITVLMMIGPVVLAALLFLFEARHRRLLRNEGIAPSSRWVARHWAEVLLVALPVFGVAVISAQYLPALLARHDDGLRGVRTIAGNGVTLVWAPRGPGWNWQAPDASYPSWEALAFHGAPPLERCAYLSEDGAALLVAPARIWRMPTSDEIVRSLTRAGVNAGCAWDRRSPHAVCRTEPDKETPLWAPDDPPIYYWSAESPDSRTAFAVNYTGGISVLPRSQPNLGIGFRCVRPAPAAVQ